MAYAHRYALALLAAAFLLQPGCKNKEAAETAGGTSPVVQAASAEKQLTDEQIRDIIQRSYQYVAMYNVNNKMALQAGGWNKCLADTALKDHNMKLIARPNNDSLYIMCPLDLRQDPMILEMPAFDSKYVSLMVTAYDHYVTVPMSVTKGDFKKPEKVLYYSARTEGYAGEPVPGVDRIIKSDGDFISAVFRVMPHAAEEQRFAKIKGQMQTVMALSLSTLQGKPAKAPLATEFPAVSKSDTDTFAGNYYAVMQFVVNHLTFDPNDELDAAFLQDMKAIGIEPGKEVSELDLSDARRQHIRMLADEVKQSRMSQMMDGGFAAENGLKLFQTKGKMTLDLMAIQSVVGPIGLPASEAIYPPVLTTDGAPLNAANDYVLHMSKDQLPPARAFWSLTLYDSANGFFIPNDRKKYSVGENGGMKLNADGGIDIYIAAQQPKGVPLENWLPINRQDEKLDVIMRIYDPDIAAFANYKQPTFEKVQH